MLCTVCPSLSVLLSWKLAFGEVGPGAARKWADMADFLPDLPQALEIKI